jgi:hypothetical protein
MNDEEKHAEPTAESLEEMPEVDFSSGIRPNRYANLRGDFDRAVFIDEETWEHFGTEERIQEALRLLVELAKRGQPTHAA